jgi:hypothetical protein
MRHVQAHHLHGNGHKSMRALKAGLPTLTEKAR